MSMGWLGLGFHGVKVNTLASSLTRVLAVLTNGKLAARNAKELPVCERRLPRPTATAPF